MIYYNSNTINDWNFGDDNIIKVYKHGAVCYYKITSGDTPTPVQEPCFAVVDNISQYSDTEFEDVYDKATEKWYKLNNLNQYEEYGIYGSGITITTYEGKLTIDGDYEYQYSGGSWVNVGEVSGSTITIKSPEYIEKTSSFRSGYIDLDYVLKDNSMFQLKVKPTNNGGSIVFGQQNATADNNDYRIFWSSGRLYYDYGSDRKYGSQALNNTYEYEVGNYYVKNLATSATVLTGTTKSGTATSMTREIGMWSTSTSSNDYAQIFYVKIYEGNTLIRDLIPWTDMNGNYGMFDKLSLTTYRSTNALTASTVINDVEVGGGYEYPLEYPVKQDPPDNLVFSSMAEAEAYECPWVGMKATIDGDKYVFSGDSQSGYEWVEKTSRLPDGYTEVEYVQNTGTSYLDISFMPNTNTRILTEMQAVSSSNYPRLFGAGMWNAAAGINLAYQSDGGTNNIHINWYGRTSWSYYTSFTFDYDKHTYDLDKNYLYRDETLVGSTSYTTSYQSTDNLGVFTYISGGRPSQSGYWGQEHFKGKMYSFKVYDNGTLVRDLVPCIKDSDNTVGAYDIVNDVFYTVPTGYTTDKLIAGDPV